MASDGLRDGCRLDRRLIGNWYLLGKGEKKLKINEPTNIDENCFRNGRPSGALNNVSGAAGRAWILTALN
jgi:hypothetical protein